MLTQAQIDKQNKILRSLRIAEFITCPACAGYGVKECGMYQTICDECDGTGRMYFNNKQTLLDRWRALPKFKRLNYIFMASFVATTILALAIMKACGVQ